MIQKKRSKLAKEGTWEDLLRRERGQQIVLELIRDCIIAQAGNIVYERYIQRRVVPFAVLQARQSVVAISQVNLCTNPPHATSWK
jgi:hypothetical protein